MKFSVLLPTHNRLELLHYAVETVLRQDYTNWEIIISDNFSEEDIAGYVSGLKDERIRYLRTNEFVSVTQNWNNALAQASGDYVIMLGDDDGLMPSFFHMLANLIQNYQQPDFIYSDAYLFAYAGALPDFDSARLRYGYNLYFTSRQPFVLERPAAEIIVRQALNLDIPIFYNMQLSTIRLDFIRSLSTQGTFFQSPFPDYYATIVSFLKAPRILIYQQPIVTIGISKKSFGFYFFSQRQKEGERFLNNISEQQVNRLRELLLPGSVEYTCRMIAMDTVATNYPQEIQQASAAVDYEKYRAAMIRFVISSYYSARLLAHEDLQEMRQNLTFREWLRYNIPYTFFYGAAGLLGPHFRSRVKEVAQKMGLFTKTVETTWKPTPCETILDVFEQLPPELK
jgi:glycosyltransferase involved in cell wall biosynthesis